MDKLHLLRSEPDMLTEKLMAEISGGGSDCFIRLYEECLDWEDVLEAIFKHDSVVCWW